jgi:hypothetical protein
MNAGQLGELMMPVINAIADRIRAVEERVAALEAAQPEPLVFPTIDLGLVEGTK